MSKEQREFARVPVSIAAGVLPVEEERVDRVREEIRLHASVWGPTDEPALRDLVSSASGSAEAMLAQAVLDLTAQVVRLRAKVLDSRSGMYSVRLEQVSGGGGMLITSLPLKTDDFLEIRFEDDDNDLPPIRALVRIVHVSEQPSHHCGFSFDAIHERDRDRLIRLIYKLQRRALRGQAV